MIHDFLWQQDSAKDALHYQAMFTDPTVLCRVWMIGSVKENVAIVI